MRVSEIKYHPVSTLPKLTHEQRKQLHGKIGAFNFVGQLIDTADTRTELRSKMNARGLTNGIHWYAYCIKDGE